MSDDTKQHPTCRYCGSASVSADAAVRWNNQDADWEISSVFDGGHCDHCEEDMKFFTWKDTV